MKINFESQKWQEHFRLCENLAMLSGVALFVIGCVAAAGHFNGRTALLGKISLGLGAPVLGLALMSAIFDPKKGRLQKIGIITLAAIFSIGAITAGSLGLHSIANAKQIGWGIIGPSVGILGGAAALAWGGGILSNLKSK